MTPQGQKKEFFSLRRPNIAFYFIQNKPNDVFLTYFTPIRRFF